MNIQLQTDPEKVKELQEKKAKLEMGKQKEEGNETNVNVSNNNVTIETKTNEKVKLYDVHGVNDGLQLQVSVANDEITNKLIVRYNLIF